jgi:hypothetical protein
VDRTAGLTGRDVVVVVDDPLVAVDVVVLVELGAGSHAGGPAGGGPTPASMAQVTTTVSPGE